MLQDKLIKYIESQRLFAREDKLLLAVSGGADSMAMLYALVGAGYSCAVAHVNFHLRGDESNRDESLVRNACDKLGVTFYKHDEDTYAYAKEYKQSIEMAAREIRYDFFERLMLQYSYDCVTVAHHADDLVETFFINLMRGTGLAGLSGIAAINGKVVRPFLWSSHQELISYLEENGYAYGVDHTNFDTTILRNKLRHDVIPGFEDQKPGFKSIMQRSMNRLRESEAVVKAYIEEWKTKYVSTLHGDLYINIDALYAAVSPSEILFYILQPLGFSTAIIDDLSVDNNKRVGAFFESSSHRLIIDRENIILAKKADDLVEHHITKEIDALEYPMRVEIQKLENDHNFNLVRSASIAYLDAEMLEFPLTLRHWHEGDTFRPIGMKGKKKKISDFFIDKKMSLIEKEKTWLLCSGKDIVWVVGHRLDDRFKVSDSSKSIYQIQLL